MAARESSGIPFCVQAEAGLHSEPSYRFEHSPPYSLLVILLSLFSRLTHSVGMRVS
jgi:hypothetical protein